MFGDDDNNNQEQLDNEDVGFELNELISAVPKEVSKEELVTESQRQKELEEERKREEEEIAKKEQAKQKKLAEQERLLKEGSGIVVSTAQEAPAENLQQSPDTQTQTSEIETPEIHEQEVIEGSKFKTTIKNVLAYGKKSRQRPDETEEQKAERKRKYERTKSLVGVGLMSVTGLILALFIYAAFTLSDIESRRASIIANVKQITGMEMTIDGKIDFIPLPPRFVLEKVKLKNVEGGLSKNFLAVNEVRATPSIIHLIFGTTKITSIELAGPTVNFENFSKRKPNWKFNININDQQKHDVDDLVSKYIDIDKLIITDGVISFSSGNIDNPAKRVFKISNSYVKADSPQGPFYAEGVFDLDKINSSLNYKLQIAEMENNKDAPVNLALKSKNLDVIYDGVIKVRDRGNTAIGNINATVADSIQGLEVYFGKKDSLANRIGKAFFSGKDGKANAKVTLTSNDMKLNNLTVKSEYIQANADIEAVFKDISDVKVNLQVDKINLDIVDDDNAEDSTYVFIEDSESNSLGNLSQGFAEDINLNLDMNLKEIIYDKVTFRDIKLKGDFGHDGIRIKKFYAKNLPGDISIALNGKMRKIGKDKKEHFVGKFVSGGKSIEKLLDWLDVGGVGLKKSELQAFKFDSDISIDGGTVSLNNYNFKGAGLDIKGDINFSKKEKYIVNMSANSNYFNVDRFFDTKSKDIDIKSRKQNYALFDWLRRVAKIFDEFNIKLNIDNVKFRNQNVKSFLADAFYGDAKAKLSNVSFITESGKLELDISLDNTKMTPYIISNIYMDKFDTAVAKKFLEISDTEEEKKWQENPAYWSPQIFDLKMFNIFDGEIDFKIDTIIHRNLEFKKNKGKILIENKKLTLQNIKSRIFNGSLKVNGVIDTSTRPSFSLKMITKNFNFKEFTSKFLGAGKGIAGNFSATGAFEMSGYSMREMINSLVGEINLVSRGAIFDGADLSMLSTKIPKLRSLKEAEYWTRFAVSKGHINTNYLSGKIKLSKGIASFDNINMIDHLISRGVISGSVDMNKWTMDTKMDLVVKAKGKSIPLDLTLKGYLSNPEKRWSEDKIIAYWKNIFFSR